VVHLEDKASDRNSFANAFPSIAGSIQGFLEKTFPPGSVQIELVQYANVEELRSGLLRDGAVQPTEVGQSILFFVLDYFVPLTRDAEPQALPLQDVGGMPFHQWLATVYPQSPVVLLTVGDPHHVEEVPAWRYLNKDVLRNRDDFVKWLSQLYEQWWRPTFWQALEEYGSSTGATSWHTPGHNAGNAFARSPFQCAFYEAYGRLTFQTEPPWVCRRSWSTPFSGALYHAKV